MRTGADVAIEAADVTLTSGELRGVVTALALSRATMRYVKQNFLLAFGYNVPTIPVAAAVPVQRPAPVAAYRRGRDGDLQHHLGAQRCTTESVYGTEAARRPLPARHKTALGNAAPAATPGEHLRKTG